MSLQMPGDLVIANTLDELYDTLANRVQAIALDAVEQRGAFHLALSGGSTPEKFYMRLASDPRFRDLPWAETHVWIVDERRVAPEDDRYNFKMIEESLTQHVPIRKRNLHPMPVLDDDPATVYEATMRDAFGLSSDIDPSDHVPRIDFVLLGMGGDCHTASLFPDSPALAITDRWIAVNDGPNVTPPDRVTMTYPLINAARHVAPLVTGEGKAAAVKQIAAQFATGSADTATMPITGIAPKAGTLTWYLDVAAADMPEDDGKIDLA